MALYLLDARIRAVNAAHACANEMHPLLYDYFLPLVGAQILRADGNLMKRLANDMPQLPHRHDLTVFRSYSRYHLQWTVNASADAGNGHCVSHSTVVTVGKFSSTTPSVLEDLMPFEPLRTDWTQSQVVALREACREAKRQFDVAVHNLSPFGEH